MSNFKFCISPFLICCLFTGFAICACSGDLSDKEHLEKAIQHTQQGDLKSATIESKNALSKNPDNGDAHLLLGTLYLKQGDALAAEKELRQAIASGKDKNTVLLPLVEALFAQKKYQQVLIEVGIPAELPQQSRAELIAFRGDAWLALEKPDKAEAEYRTALSFDNNAAMAKLGLAKLALNRNDLDQARQLVEDSLKTSPKNSRLWRMQALIANLQGHKEAAEKAYTKVINLEPNNHLLELVNRAIVRMDLQQLTSAEQDLERLGKLAPKHPLTHYVRGRLAVEKKNYPQAQAELEQAIKFNPDFIPPYLPLGITHLAQDHFSQAELALKRFVSNNPASVAAKRALALTRYRLHAYQDAKQTLQSILEQAPADAFSLALSSQIETQLGNHQKAEEFTQKLLEYHPEAIKITSSTEEAGGADREQMLEAALRLNPDFFPAQVQLAFYYLRNDQLQKAEQILQQLQRESPGSAITLSVGGILQAKKGQLEAAEKSLQEALNLSPENPNVAFALADIYGQKDEYVKARKLYEKVLQVHPKNPDVPMRLAILDVKEGKMPNAVKRLQILLQDHPRSLKPRLLLSRLYLRDGKPDLARSVLEKAAADHPDSSEVLRELTQLYLATQQLDRAQEAAGQVLKLLPNTPDSHLLAAQVAMSGQNWQGAEQSLQKALTLDSKNLSALLGLGQLYASRNQPQKVMPILAKLRQFYPDDPQVLARVGQLASRLGDADEAIEAYRKAIELRPRSDWIGALAKLYWQAGERETSTKLIRQWREKYPNDPELTYLLASLNQKAGNQKEARSLLEHTLSLNPQHIAALNNLAWILRDQNPEQALEFARRAAKLAPQSAAVADTLAMILLQQGKNAAALRVMEPVSQQFTHPEIQLHWAAILIANHRKDQARGLLLKLLETSEAASAHTEARALLQQIASRN